MIQFIKNIFGLGPKADYKELMKKGAQIIDVRSGNEFKGGHIAGSVNIPLDILPKNIAKIKKDKPVITCCASGIRSSSAKRILKTSGYEVYNGGGWMNLQTKIS